MADNCFNKFINLLKGEIMSKINKLGKSTFVIAILSLILVAVLSFGGTYAYFSAKTDGVDGTVTMGHLKLTDSAFGATTIKTTESVKAVPNQTVIDGAVSVSVDANINYFIRAIVSTETTLASGHTTEDSCVDKAVDLFSLSLTTTGWEKSSTTGTNGEQYVYCMTASKDASKSLNLVAKIAAGVGEESSDHFMDATITVTVKFEAIQADYILGTGDKTAADAGTITVDQLEAAWETAVVKAD